MFSKLQIWRALHTTLPEYARRQRTKYLAQQLDGLKGHEGEEEEFLHDIGDLESDFMNVHKSHGEYESEQVEQRERTRRYIIKNKYFRDEHLPNMLTYAEKEQIRLLNARSSAEWPVEKLAESFPANIDIISKVLRAKWRPQNAKRLKAHDEAVLRNWQKLHSDDNFAAKFSNELREHLMQFSKRKLTSYELPNRLQIAETKSKEFSSIISTCKKYKNLQITAAPDVPTKTSSAFPMQMKASPDRLEDETFLVDNVVDKRQIRLQEFKEMKKQDKLPDESLIKNNCLETNVPSYDRVVKKFEENEIIISEEDAVRYAMTPFKSHIHIPRKLWKKGFVFRVDDKYYDDDGEFLFKVPGMTGKFI